MCRKRHRIRPYENYIYQAATRIYKVYRTEIFGVLALICLSLAFLIYELRKNIQLNEIQRNVLKSEVRSREFYRSAVEEHTVFCMLTRDGTISHVNQHFLNAKALSTSTLPRFLPPRIMLYWRMKSWLQWARAFRGQAQ
jgi:hypothetical protein